MRPMMALLRVDAGAGAGPVSTRLDSPLGLPISGEWGDGSVDLFGEVQVGFDRVVVECEDGATVDATVVDCTAYVGFNYWVAPVMRSWPVQILATSPEGISASLRLDDQEV